MSQLNKKNTAQSVGLKKTNHEGSVQYVKPAEQQLLEIAVMSLWGKDSFYESNDERLVRIDVLIHTIVAKGQLDFIANTIRYAREEMHIRSVPIIIAVLFARAVRDNNLVYPHMRNVICDAIQRADQITDMYAVALGIFGDKKNIPMAIKRGTADAFNKFNEYQFGKWNRQNSVKFRDVLRIVHPKPINAEQGELFARIMADTVEIPETHEVLFSVNGQLPANERKNNADIWAELINKKKLGYQATLMNVRRMLNDNVDITVLNKVVDRLTNPNEVAKSKMLPFQFVAAYNAVSDMTTSVSYSNLILNALSDAIDISLTNLPLIGDGIVIIVDLSASMQTYQVAGRYNINGYAQTVGTPATIAAMFTAALFKANIDARNISLIGFSDNASFIKANARDSVISIKDQVLRQTRAGGTNLHSALELFRSSVQFKPDTVILLSDMQIQNCAEQWGQRADVSAYFPADAVKIAVNLDAYETTPVPAYKGWTQLCGWSPRIFDMIPAMREGNIKSAVKLLSGPYIK